MPEMDNVTSQKLPGSEPSAQNITGNQSDLDDLINNGNYNGSLQQMLSQNTGRRIIVDFLVGTNNIVRREGILYLVGISYIVLYDERADIYTVCNLYSIEFVSFLPNGSSSTAATTVAKTTLKRV